MQRLLPNYRDGFFNLPESGFLPDEPPLAALDEAYSEVQKALDCLHVQHNGGTGTLATAGAIVDVVNQLPNMLETVKSETEPRRLQALFRAYSFLTSAYTLEPSYQEFLKSGKYGAARTVLPEQLSMPFVCVAEKLDYIPWMDYHYSYSLGNYVKKDASKDLHWKNLDMAVKFAGTSDEVGFIMLHVYINELSPQLLKSIYMCHDAMSEHKAELSTVARMNEGLELNFNTIKGMNKRRQEMWAASNPKNYNDFRVFIMGIKGNEDLFGDGLVYKGCFNDEPQQFRGQTGAQDDIIPTQDIFTGLTAFYPTNELTTYLIDLRKYRPQSVQSFFKDLRSTMDDKALFRHLHITGNVEGLVWLWRIVDEIYRFRNGHWQFVQKYIMENTKYPKATGGTPITSWLINQIEACLQYQSEIKQSIDDSVSVFQLSGGASGNSAEGVGGPGLVFTTDREELVVAHKELRDSLVQKKALLTKQVSHLNEAADYNITLMYAWSKDHGLNDDPALSNTA